VRRQTEGSVVCSGCGRLVEVDEDRCPFCGQWNPGMFGYANTLRRTLGGLDVNRGIFLNCIGLYIAALALDPRALLGGSGLGILGPASRALYQLGMTGGAALQLGHWYTVFSAIFLHGGLIHIFFNLWLLRYLGPEIEDALGPTRYFLMFMAAGVGGFVISNLVNGAPTVGASGSIYGLFAARIALARAHGGELGQAISQQTMIWVALLFVLGFLQPHVNNWAHGGGFVSGYLAMRMLLPGAAKPDSPLLIGGALATAGMVALAVVLSFISISRILLRG